MKKPSIFAFIVFTLLMYGCYKKEYISINKSRKSGSYRHGTTNYIVLFQGETPYKTYLSEDNGGLLYRLNLHNVEISASFHEKDNNYNTNIGTISFGNITINPYLDEGKRTWYKDTNSTSLLQLQQQNVSFGIAVGTQNSAYLKNIYVPLSIKVGKDTINECGKKVIGGGKLTNGAIADLEYEIEWNVDAKNKNGVVVLVEWNGDIMLNDSLLQLKYSNEKKTIIDIIDDNGRHIVGEKYFKHLPDGALFTVQLLRGDVKTMQHNDKVYKITTVAESIKVPLQLRKPTKSN